MAILQGLVNNMLSVVCHVYTRRENRAHFMYREGLLSSHFIVLAADNSNDLASLACFDCIKMRGILMARATELEVTRILCMSIKTMTSCMMESCGHCLPGLCCQPR